MCSDKIIGLLDGYEEGDIKIKYIDKKGMNMRFEVEGIEDYPAVSMVKKMIRSSDWGAGLYFSVVWE